MENYSTFFDDERKENKTFKEIKNSLKVLLGDTKKSIEKRDIIQKSKKEIEDNIIKNLEQGLKIISGDYLYPLKYLTTYETIFNFSKSADKIFSGDILKLEGKKLFILRKNKKINIGSIQKINDKKTKNGKKEIRNIDDIKIFDKKENHIENDKRIVKKSVEIQENSLEKNIFEKFYNNKKILNLLKKDILELTKNDYILAITILLIYKNEQGLEEGFFSRNSFKNFIKENIDKDLIKSKGVWQIRANSLGKEKLKNFFKNKKSLELNFLSLKDKELFYKLEKEFNKKGYLTKEERVLLLENKNLETILVYSILRVDKKRITYLLKKIFDVNFSKNNLTKQEIFFLTTKLADSYHLGPLGAIIGSLFTDNTLKIAEKLGILKEDGKILAYTKYGQKITNSYQVSIRKKYKGIVKSIFGKVNFYKRNTEIQKETLYRIISFFEKNNKNNYDVQNLKKEVEKIKNGYVPEKIILFIKELNKNLNINVVNFYLEDYNNIDPKKAILVGNYGPRAWSKLIK